MNSETGRIIEALREEIEALTAAQIGMKLAYSLPEAAELVSISVTTLRAEIDGNRLVPVYVGTKPVLTVWELRRWLRALPEEPHRR